MKMVGLTGGIGTGKSTVAQLMIDHGWKLISSDDTAREIMNTNPNVRAQVAELLGSDVLVDGGLDRAKIAERVFGDTPEHRERLDRLDQIVHPAVLQQHLETLEEEREKGTPLVAIESALLFEVGLDDGFDWVVVVDAPDEVRIERVMKRSNLTEAQVRARMNEQLPMQEKKSLADFVIDNGGTLEELAQAVDTVTTIIDVMPDPETTPIPEDNDETEE